MKNLMVYIPKLTMEIASCDTTRQELNGRIPELKAECSLNEEDATKLVALNDKVDQCC